MTAPHPALTGFYADPAGRQAFVTALFDRAARHYDRINLVMSLGLGAFYRGHALARAGLGPGMRVLDVATGTGLVARAAGRIVGPAGRVVGLDPSAGMLGQGRGGGVRLVQGLGEQLPFGDGMFDFVTMGFALRHMSDLEVAFAEYRRVLAPGGRLLVLEITRPRSMLALAVARGLLGEALPRVARLASGSPDAERLTRYYWETVAECVPPAAVVDAMASAGLAAARHRTYGGVLTEYFAVRPATRG